MRTTERCRGRRGATLIELLVSTGVYSFIAIALFALMRDGTRNWQAVETRTSVQSSLRMFERDITDELQRANLDSVRIFGYASGETHQHGIVFRSAMNDADNPNQLGAPLVFQVKIDPLSSLPGISWQRYVLYYISRPSTAQHVNDYGYSCSGPVVNGSDTSDYYCPHKWLIRKDVELSANLTKSSDLTDGSKTGGAGPLIESDGPDASSVRWPAPGAVRAGSGVHWGKVWRVKLLCRDILALNFAVKNAAGVPVGVVTDTSAANTGAPRPGGTVIEYDVKMVRLLEAASVLRIGNSDLSQTPFTVQLDNSATPSN